MRAAEDTGNPGRWIDAAHVVADPWIVAAASRHEPDLKDQLLVISPAPGQHGAVLQLWTDLPDEAISTLTQLLYDMRARQPENPATEQRWYWNGTAHRWELLHSPDPGHTPPDSGNR